MRRRRRAAARPATVAALTAGKPAEALIWSRAGASPADDYRAELRRPASRWSPRWSWRPARSPAQLLVFATTSGKSLEGFKDALWAVDEYAGVRYRDPGDPERHLIDISLTPASRAAAPRTAGAPGRRWARRR